METKFRSTNGIEYTNLDLVLIFSLLEGLVESRFESPEQFYNDVKILMESIIASKMTKLEKSQSFTKLEIDEISNKIIKSVEELGGKLRTKEENSGM